MSIVTTSNNSCKTFSNFFPSDLTKQANDAVLTFTRNGIWNRSLNAWKAPSPAEHLLPAVSHEAVREYAAGADALIAGALEAHFVNPHREVKENPWLTSGAASAKPHGLSEAEKQELYPLIPYTMLTSACCHMCRKAFESDPLTDSWSVTADGATLSLDEAPPVVKKFKPEQSARKAKFRKDSKAAQARYEAALRQYQADLDDWQKSGGLEDKPTPPKLAKPVMTYRDGFRLTVTTTFIKLMLCGLAELARRNDQKHKRLNTCKVSVRLDDFYRWLKYYDASDEERSVTMKHLRKAIRNAFWLMTHGSLSWKDTEKKSPKSYQGVRICTSARIEHGLLVMEFSEAFSLAMLNRTVTRFPLSALALDAKDYNRLAVILKHVFHYYFRQQKDFTRDRLSKAILWKETGLPPLDSEEYRLHPGQYEAQFKAYLDGLMFTGIINSYKVLPSGAKDDKNLMKLDASNDPGATMIVMEYADAPKPPQVRKKKSQSAEATATATAAAAAAGQAGKDKVRANTGTNGSEDPASEAQKEKSAREAARPAVIECLLETEQDFRKEPATHASEPAQAVMAEKHVSEVRTSSPSPRDFVMKETFEPGEAEWLVDCLRDYEKHPQYENGLMIMICGLLGKGYKAVTIRDWLSRGGLPHCAEAADREVRYDTDGAYADIPEPQVPLPSLTAA